MPIEIVRGDITKIPVDAMVSAANTALAGGGGVDGAIHRAAGPELQAACRALHGCKIGEAKLTAGYRLPCRYVIHTVGPVWRDGARGEAEALASCYRNALRLAKAQGCESISFPLIAAGKHGFPRDLALKTATDTIRDFLFENEMLVKLVVFDKASFRISEKLYTGIAQYIDDQYVEAHSDSRSRRRLYNREIEDCFPMECASATLEEALNDLDESFSQMVLRKIAEKGMTNVECYKRANMDRKLFCKIQKDVHYSPSKRTALALAIALELPIDETRNLLMKAGLAISHSGKFDVIVEYAIKHGIYNIFEVNEMLFSFDQMLLGE